MKLSSVRSQAASGVLPAAVGLVIALLAYSLIQTVPPAKGSTVPDSAFTFQRQGDSTTGAMLMDARVYQPVIGRFLQIDPTAGGSADMDHYGARDPISTLDLSGMYVVQGGSGGWAHTQHAVSGTTVSCAKGHPISGGRYGIYACGVPPMHGVPRLIKSCLSDGGKRALEAGVGGAALGLLGGPFSEITVPAGAGGGAISGAIGGCLEGLGL